MFMWSFFFLWCQKLILEVCDSILGTPCVHILLINGVQLAHADMLTVCNWFPDLSFVSMCGCLDRVRFASRLIMHVVFVRRSGRGQPAGRGFCERTSPARLCAASYCGVGADGGASLRHLPTTARLPRLRVQDPDPLLRDRLDPPRLHWWLKD